MSIKKTEQFIYFQNKARHYANLRSAKPTVKTHRPTLTTSLHQEPTVPYMRRYELERSNENLINRITEIMTGPRLQIQKQGYTRYNKGFSPKSHLTIEQRRLQSEIGEGNHHMAEKVLRAKPSIGTVEGWNRQFVANRQIRSNISKYNDRRVSKGTLDVYTSSKFMPQHYRSFLNHSGSKRRDESPEEQLDNRASLKVEQLFQLPKLKRLRGSLTRIGQNGQEVPDF